MKNMKKLLRFSLICYCTFEIIILLQITVGRNDCWETLQTYCIGTSPTIHTVQATSIGPDNVSRSNKKNGIRRSLLQSISKYMSTIPSITRPSSSLRLEKQRDNLSAVKTNVAKIEGEYISSRELRTMENKRMTIEATTNIQGISSSSVSISSSSSSISSTSISQQHIQPQPSSHTAVVHIGPLKTGSTYLQLSIKALAKELYLNHYELPSATSFGDVNMGDLRSCYVDHTYVNPVTKKPMNDFTKIRCNENQRTKLLEAGHKNKNNVIFTAESLSFPDTNIEQLQYDLTKNYNHVVIVIYYRRYYEWLLSSWNQVTKERKDYTKRESFFDWIWRFQFAGDGKLWDMKFYNDHYTFALVPRWKQYFENSNHPEEDPNDIRRTSSSTTVKVYNLHDDKVDPLEKFFCDALSHPPATIACAKIQKQLQQQQQQNETKGFHHHHYPNESRNLIYEDIAYAALQMNLTSVAKSKKYVNALKNNNQNNNTIDDNDNYYYLKLAGLVQDQHERVWNKTRYEFPKDYYLCLPSDILEDLYSKTVLAEKTLFPDYYERHADELQRQFDIDKETKLCTLDAETMIEEIPEWKQFFLSLEE